MARLEFEITTQWQGDPINHSPVKITLSPGINDGVLLEVDAPFFNDPPPPSPAGEPLWGLWEYEVVEVFFLAKEGHNYFEIEVGPHGQHLALVLDGYRQPYKKELPLSYTAQIASDRWRGAVNIPLEYFPPKIHKLNAYALHNVAPDTAAVDNIFFRDSRMYEALYPAPKGKHDEPEHHRIEYFRDVDFALVCPKNWSEGPSDLWKPKYC